MFGNRVYFTLICVYLWIKYKFQGRLVFCAALKPRIVLRFIQATELKIFKRKAAPLMWPNELRDRLFFLFHRSCSGLFVYHWIL